MSLSIENNQIAVCIPEVYLSQEEENSGKSSLWCINSRTKRNILRVSVAGGLSMAGGWLAGFLPTVGGILGGAFLGGVGNGASTYLAWEVKHKKLIEARWIHDVPQLSLQANALVARVEVLAKRILTNSENLPSPSVLGTADTHSACLKRRWQRNFVRIFVAGGLSAAGGWLGGFVTSAPGVIVGGILGGVGNGLSTWLAFEKKNDRALRENALEHIPRLSEILQEKTQALEELIKRIQNQNPEILLDAHQEPVALENEEEIEPRCQPNRLAVNVTYVNIAGWLSAAGGVVAGYEPNPGGILVGGFLGGAANSLSTWLAWENPHDREVTQLFEEEFPQLVLKVSRVAALIDALNAVFTEESSSYS